MNELPTIPQRQPVVRRATNSPWHVNASKARDVFGIALGTLLGYLVLGW